jgi:hypothetical protein
VIPSRLNLHPDNLSGVKTASLSRPHDDATRARCMAANRSTAVVRSMVDERSQIDSFGTLAHYGVSFLEV